MGIAVVAHNQPSTTYLQPHHAIAPVGIRTITAQAPTPSVAPLNNAAAPVMPMQTYTPGSSGYVASSPPFGSRTVPLTAAVNALGYVLIYCPPGPVSAQAYTVAARPGATIACSNGATPMLVAASAVQ